MTTKDYRSRLTTPSATVMTWSRIMCWEAVADAFGVVMPGPTGKAKYISFINKLICDAGYEMSKLRSDEVAPAGIVPTLAVFMQAHLTGDYVVYTCNHVVSIRDGRITDRTGTQQTVTRRVECAYKVTKI
jgi:hypothetical protein